VVNGIGNVDFMILFTYVSKASILSRRTQSCRAEPPYAELCVELRAKLRVELRAKLRVELRAKLRVELRAKLRVELRAELRAELRTEL